MTPARRPSPSAARARRSRATLSRVGFRCVTPASQKGPNEPERQRGDSGRERQFTGWRFGLVGFTFLPRSCRRPRQSGDLAAPGLQDRDPQVRSDAQTGEQVDQLEDEVGRDGRIRLRPRDDFLHAFPRGFDQSGLVPLVHGLNQLRGGLGESFRVGRWLGLVQLLRQVAQEIGDLGPGARVQVLGLADARRASSFIAFSAGRSGSSLGDGCSGMVRCSWDTRVGGPATAMILPESGMRPRTGKIPWQFARRAIPLRCSRPSTRPGDDPGVTDPGYSRVGGEIRANSS